MRHLDNFAPPACLPPLGSFTLHTPRQITSPFAWSIIVQTDRHESRFARHRQSTSSSAPIHSRLPLLRAPSFIRDLEKKDIRSATLAHKIPRHTQIRSPYLPRGGLFTYSPSFVGGYASQSRYKPAIFSLTILLFHNDPQALFCTTEGRLD